MILEGVDPARCTTGSVNYSELHDRIRIAGLRIRSYLDGLMKRNVVDYGELRYRSVIDSQVREGC